MYALLPGGNVNNPNNQSCSTSVGLPSEEAIRNVIGPSYEPDKVLNVIKMMAGTEDMYQASVGFIEALFQTEDVEPRIREMIMLRAAKVLHCQYEWEANTVLGRNVGLSDVEIEAAGMDGPVTGIDAKYVLICAATDELSLRATLTDATLIQMLSRYGDVVSRKLILMIGWFNLLARFLNGCRVPLEDFSKLQKKTDPLG
jgi:4-carboxymuconolactone decarboxylase